MLYKPYLWPPLSPVVLLNEIIAGSTWDACLDALHIRGTPDWLGKKKPPPFAVISSKLDAPAMSNNPGGPGERKVDTSDASNASDDPGDQDVVAPAPDPARR